MYFTLTKQNSPEEYPLNTHFKYKYKNIFTCHRARNPEGYDSQVDDNKRRKLQKRSGKVDCSCSVELIQEKDAELVTVKYKKLHTGHQLGSAEDITYLKLDDRRKDWLKEIIADGLLQHGR